MMAGRKQTKTKDLIMMKPGLRAQIPASPSLSLASASSQRPLHYTNAGYENADTLSTGPDYEEVDLYRQATGPRRSPNSVYENSTSLAIPQHMGSQRKRQITECSDDSTSTSSVEHYQDRKKTRCKDLMLIFMVFTSVASLVFVSLIAFGYLGPKCTSCETKKVTGGGVQYMTKLQRPERRNENYLEIIKALKENITSLENNKIQMLGKMKRFDETIFALQERLDRFTNQHKEYQSIKIKNITKEVKALRTKQEDLDTSLEDLKSYNKTTSSHINDLDRQVNGLAISINYLTRNDSLIKSQVIRLFQSDSQTKMALAALKGKDMILNSTIKGLESNDVAVNASLSRLTMFGEQMKTKLSLVNSTVTSKIKSITDIVNKLKQGSSGSGADLTKCVHRQKTSTASNGNAAMASVYYTVEKDKVVTGVTCSTKGGDETNLDVQVKNNRPYKYACQCLGQSTSTVGKSGVSIKCRIDYWVCPSS